MQVLVCFSPRTSQLCSRSPHVTSPTLGPGVGPGEAQGPPELCAYCYSSPAFRPAWAADKIFMLLFMGVAAAASGRNF